MRLIGLPFVVFLFMHTLVAGQDHLMLNEMMSNNETTIADEVGDYPDWIEIINMGGLPVSLESLYLSDDSSNLNKWAFPAIELKPDSFLFVFASGKNITSGPYLHTNFKIDSDGEWLFLSDSQLHVIDSLQPVALEDDIAFGRRPDGSEEFYFFDLPTPGYSNKL